MASDCPWIANIVVDRSWRGCCSRLVRSFLASLFVAASVVLAQAQNIPISNHSFENPPLADGASTFGITGWSGGGIIGTINPDSSLFPGGAAPDGSNIAFIRTDETSNFFGSFDQTLSAVVTANTLYTLTVDVGRGLTGDFGNFQVTLSEAQERNSLAFATGPAPAPGEFVTLTLTYFAEEGSPYLGRQLVVGATSFNAFSGGDPNDTVYFDNFRLSAVPEPSSIVLMGFGALGLVACAVRRRKARA